MEERPKEIVAGGGDPTFVNSPSVNGNVEFEPGRHWVLARDNTTPTGRLWFAESHQDGEMVP